MTDFPFETPWFVLRTPLLPLTELHAWSAGLEAPGASEGTDADLERALAADRARLRSRLAALLERPEVREAVFVASPSLWDGLELWRRDPESKKGRRAEQTLVRYLARMAGRATPFGLFAGITIGRPAPGAAAEGASRLVAGLTRTNTDEHGRTRTGAEPGASRLVAAPGAAPGATRLVLAPRSSYRRSTRLDMDYLCSLAAALGRDPALRRELRYRPNSSLHRHAGRWRYTETRLRERWRTHHLVTVEATPYLDAALARAGQAGEGARLAEVALAIAAADPDGEVTLEEAAEFAEELIDNGLLISDLEPPVTGREPLADLLATLSACPSAAPVAERLAAVAAEIARLDAGGLGAEPRRYREIADLLAPLPAEPQLARLFQVDLSPTFPATAESPALGPEVLAEIARGIAILHRFCGSLAYDPLGGFRQAFVERWGEGREVPLLAALDDEMGIPIDPAAVSSSEAAPLLQGLALGPGGPPPQPRWRSSEAFLLPKLEAAWQSGAREIVLTDADLAPLTVPDLAPLPAAFHALATVAAADQEALARGDFEVYVAHASGPAGARMVGRFCHGDAAARAAVEDHLAAEEGLDPEALHAEVVHLPEGRVGNILCRPPLRGWEIPYLGRSGAPPERQIPLGDLLVTVLGNRVVLRSRTLGKRIEPRLTSSHNYDQRGLAVYRFLCMIQQQGVAHGVLWSWGALGQALFTPRVRYGRAVLMRARWRVPAEELAALTLLTGAGRWRAVQRWRERRGLPRWVVLAENDQELPVDLDNTLAVDSFLAAVHGRPEIHLLETFLPPSRLLARGPDGGFVHELCLAFQRTAPARQARHRSAAAVSALSAPGPAAFPRSFAPGSEWLFAKLYTGAAGADRVLREVVAPLVRQARARSWADGWFFLRYGDPGWHVRVRFRGEPEQLTAELGPALAAAAAPFQADGTLWKVQLDTYEREVERYGGPEGLVLAERLFEADSDAALAILAGLQGDQGEEARWRLTLLGIDRLLGDLGLDLPGRLAVVRPMAEAMAEEAGGGKALRLSLDQRFRGERKGLEALLQGEIPLALAAGVRALEQRSAELAPVAAALAAALGAPGANTRLGSTVPELARSYVHMHVNRMVRAAARHQELVLYDLLARLYESRLARGGD